MAKITSPYIVPDDHVALVGRIAGAWAHLEFEIDVGIWRLTNTAQQLAACITSQLMSVHPRIAAFKGLVQVRGGSQKSVDDINTFYGNISGLVERRNRVVHDTRFRQKDTLEVHRLEITAKGRAVQFGFTPENKDELQRTLTQISDRVREFVALRNKIIDEIEALPKEAQPILQEIIPVRKSPSTPASGE